MRKIPDTTGSIVSADVLERLDLENPARSRIQQAYQEALNRPPRVSSSLVGLAMRAGEFLIVILTGLFAASVHPGSYFSDAPFAYIPITIVSATALVLTLSMMGLYRIRRLLDPVQQMARIGAAWLLLFMTTTLALFLLKAGDTTSRTWLIIWFISGYCGIVLFRFAAGRFAERWNGQGQFDRHAILIGGGDPAAKLITALRNSHDAHVTVGGIFDDRDDQRSPPVVEGLHKLGTIYEIVDFVRRARVDLLLVTLPLTAEDRLLNILKQLWVLPVDIRLSAYSQKLRYRPRAYSYVGNVPFLDVFDRPLGDWDNLVKSAEDKIVAALLLTLLSPLMLLIALAVKLESKGPVFFKQKRYGFNNELIEVYKFRSMYDETRDPDASKLVTKNDPRVTRVGRFIRRASLDELPQLINVLRGDLSLVGPRPHPTRAKAGDQLYNDVVDGYFARHRVKPGITGWAQINGWRGETDTAEKLQRRVEHDLYYIENWSLFFDLSILLRTPAALFKGENAY
jgi:Undecaprenyl-phosphate glucose phosphotransferase